MIVLTGCDLVLPDRVVPGGSLLIDDGQIVGVEPRQVRPASAEVRALDGHLVVPGFIDVHVHGVEGTDVLDAADAVSVVAARLPRYGVTGFCPTSVACDPRTLAAFLDGVARARTAPGPGSARVLGAHLESNFINPAWNGAQPAECLRTYAGPGSGATAAGAFTADDIMRVIHAGQASVGIVTVAPELDGGLDLVRVLRDRGHLVSIGHSGASYEQSVAAINAGVTHATHLFNRMTPLTHRQPGSVGAVLESRRVAAELICDGHHVHPAALSLAIRAKSAERVMAISDGTAVAGLPVGARARLGGRPIVAGAETALLEDGTLAGSRITMDRAFRTLVTAAGVPLHQAAQLCATTPATQLELPDRGRLAPGLRADFVVLSRELGVVETWIDGRRVTEP
jgi:N-acetylglucosamine-6-phosphate deacetylase